MLSPLAPARSGFVPEQNDLSAYVPGKALAPIIPPVYVSHGAGPLTVSPPQATAATATHHAKSLMSNPRLFSVTPPRDVVS